MDEEDEDDVEEEDDDEDDEDSEVTAAIQQPRLSQLRLLVSAKWGKRDVRPADERVLV